MTVRAQWTNTMRWITAVALMIGLPASARAVDCANASAQSDLNECAGKAFDAADAALNATYKEVMARLKDAEASRKLLVAAQKTWLGFRDGECDFETSSTIGGSVHPMVVIDCKTEMTKARTTALRAMLNCEDGDLACPIPPK